MRKMADEPCWNDKEFYAGYEWSCRRFIKNKDAEYWSAAVKQSYAALIYTEQTDELCKLAIEANASAIFHIKNQTDELCKMAIKLNPETILYIKNQTDELCKLAVGINGYMIGYIKNQTEELCMIAINEDYKSFSKIIDPSEKVCIAVVKKDSTMYNYVHNKTPAIHLAAGGDGYYPFKNHVFEYATDDDVYIGELVGNNIININGVIQTTPRYKTE